MNGSVIESAKFTEFLSNSSTHYHNCYEVIYIEEGHLNICIDNKQYTISKPSLIFISKLEHHSVTVLGDKYKRYFICISPILASNMIREYSLLTVLSNRHEKFCHVIDVSSIKAEMDRIFSSIVFEHNSVSPYSTQKQAALLLELLISIYRLNPSLFSNENKKKKNFISL